MKYFGRVYKLEIGDGERAIVFDGFPSNSVRRPAQIEFRIDQTPAAERAYSEITIYGVKKETRRAIYEQFSKVRLTAGWRDQFGVVFNGDLENTELGRDGPDSFVKLFCQSSAKTWRGSFINRSFGAGTPYLNILREVASTFGATVKFIGDFSDLPKAVTGVTLSRDSKSVLREYGKNFGFEWLHLGSVLYIVKDGASLPDGGVFEYTAINGLIGSPELTLRGVNIDVLLNPHIRPWDRFQVNAVTGQLNFNGVYYKRFPETIGKGINTVVSLVHEGSYYGDTWQTQLEGRREVAF